MNAREDAVWVADTITDLKAKLELAEQERNELKDCLIVAMHETVKAEKSSDYWADHAGRLAGIETNLKKQLAQCEEIARAIAHEQPNDIGRTNYEVANYEVGRREAAIEIAEAIRALRETK